MPGYRFRLGSLSSHSSRGSNQDSSQGENNKSNGLKYEIKLAVLGKTGCGKTSIIHRFLYDQFPEKHKETIDEVYLNELELVKGVDTRLTLDILDCGGSNEFPAMKRIGILNSNAFILVYSIDDQDSFDEVARLRDLIYEIKLEKHIAKYSTKSETQKQVPIKTDTFVKKETNSIISFNNSAIRQPVTDLKLGQQRRYSLQTPLNGTYTTNVRTNVGTGQSNSRPSLNGLTGQLSNPLNEYLFNSTMNDQQQNNNLKKRHHHHKNKTTNEKKLHKKPYILSNINQRYKLSENLKLISERRKSLSNSAKISELKSKLDNISETVNDINHQQHTADILCLRPNSKLQTTSLPVYGTTTNTILFNTQQRKEQSNQLNDRTTVDDILDEESNNIIKNNANRGRRRSSFLLSPDSLSCSDSSSCSSSDSENESEKCEYSCSSSSSCCSLNSKSTIRKQDKENITSNFEHINNLNNHKSKLDILREQEERLQLDDNIPAFEPPVIVVVGNKCDLESKRAVQRKPTEDIVEIDWEPCGFIECSAKENYRMTDIFKEMLRQSKFPFVVSNALDSHKNRRRSLPAYPSNGLHLKEPTFRTKRNSCALS